MAKQRINMRFDAELYASIQELAPNATEFLETAARRELERQGVRPNVATRTPQPVSPKLREGIKPRPKGRVRVA